MPKQPTIEKAAATPVLRGWWAPAECDAFVAEWIADCLSVTEERTGKQVEETLNEVLSDLSNDRLGKGAAEQLKGAADGSIKRQSGSEGLGRAIRSR